jgi:general secretion pathway protein J
MKLAHSPNCEGVAGFTMIEAVVTLALMGFILAALATITAQWLPNWNRGVGRVQAEEKLALGLERATADLAAAEFIPVSVKARQVFFDGTDRSATFVRTAMGPNAGPGLEVIRIAEVNNSSGWNLVRTRAVFAPGVSAVGYPKVAKFTDPVVLLRAAYRVTFSYAGIDRVWRDSWQQQLLLPSAIRLTLRDVATRRKLSVSTATLVHVELPLDCVVATSVDACLNAYSKPVDDAQGGGSRS